jgi:hypothetical protein
VANPDHEQARRDIVTQLDSPECTYTPMKKAAKYYDVSISSIRRWIDLDVLRAVRINGTIRVDLSSLRYELVGGAAA